MHRNDVRLDVEKISVQLFAPICRSAEITTALMAHALVGLLFLARRVKKVTGTRCTFPVIFYTFKSRIGRIVRAYRVIYTDDVDATDSRTKLIAHDTESVYYRNITERR